MNQDDNDQTIFDAALTSSEAIRDKFVDAFTPGVQIECDPVEADRLGAFAEDALSEADALESNADLIAIADGE